jgi:hypothetical protein
MTEDTESNKTYSQATLTRIIGVEIGLSIATASISVPTPRANSGDNSLYFGTNTRKERCTQSTLPARGQVGRGSYAPAEAHQNCISGSTEREQGTRNGWCSQIGIVVWDANHNSMHNEH